MGQMKIQHKLFLGFLLVAVLIIIFGHIAMRLNENIAVNLKQLSRGSMIENMYAMEFFTALQSSYIASQEYIQKLLVERYLLDPNSAQAKFLKQQIDMAKRTIRQRLADCKKYLEISKKGAETSIELARQESPGGIEFEELEEIESSHNRLNQTFSQYLEIMKKFMGLSQKESLDEAAYFLENMLEPHSWQLTHLVQTIRNDSKRNLDEEVTRIQKNISTSDKIITISIIVSFIIAIIVSLLISRNISRPIIRLRDLAVKIGKGFFDEKIEIKSRDEVGILASTFGEMSTRLKEKTTLLEEAKTDLEKQNITLEEKVKERTSQLSQSNKQLKKEIEERKLAEEKISKSLHEKELLLKEIHHRVKNNLQIICSLLGLQSDITGSPEAVKALEESQNRIRSMAMIHEILYNSEDFSKIDFGKYVEQLTDHLIDSCAESGTHIITEINMENIFLKLGKAIPCGLIISELYINSLKYAFPNSTVGKIIIEMSKEHNDLYTLKFQDNGKGLPENFALEKTETLGVQLVVNLTRQLGGSIQLEGTKGTRFIIKFPSRP